MSQFLIIHSSNTNLSTKSQRGVGARVLDLGDPDSNLCSTMETYWVTLGSASPTLGSASPTSQGCSEEKIKRMMAGSLDPYCGDLACFITHELEQKLVNRVASSEWRYSGDLWECSLGVAG